MFFILMLGEFFMALLLKVIKKIFAKAIEIKDENDLTVQVNAMIIVNLDVMLAKRKMSSLELASRVGITQATLSI